ncbi:D-aminoacyl-tRNA deacylase [Nannocystis sp.]|uniref:D-aminoacyl-tRNA deacylase n=1 Tax=Nannocystis sp. TaxID=1962667 RepID=UPI0025F0E760|nr:D-aminoacyl-tRNA deacylase [Nannocystis sp.]MBK7830574.1 D-tyrosyl-tRNA(Tyr) deacylase [Nannocystis sp.]
MKTVLQRVTRAQVRVDGAVVGEIGRGLLALCAIEKGDGPADVRVTADKLVTLRCFPGATPMDRSVLDVGGAVLLVSQFTIAGTLKKGRRPGFDPAAPPDEARALYEQLAAAIRGLGVVVDTGRFAAHMEVELVNDGPVTLLLFTQGGSVVH